MVPASNTTGAKFNFWGYDYLWAADIGNRSYQDKLGRQRLRQAEAADTWDGVFVDDTNPTIRYHYTPESGAGVPDRRQRTPPRPASALSVIGPALKAQGKLVIPNFGAWRDYRTAVSSWLPYVSGGMEEQFTKWGNDPAIGYVTGVDWDSQLAILKETQAAGKYSLIVAHSTATDANAARYGWATTLLAGTGKASFSLAENYTGESWFPEYDYDLGKAVGVESKLSSGVHKRVFERGIVLVNPTLGSVPVSFGARYHGSGLTTRSSTTMGAHTGLILLKEAVANPLVAAGAAPAAAAPAPQLTPEAAMQLVAQPVSVSAAQSSAPAVASDVGQASRRSRPLPLRKEVSPCRARRARAEPQSSVVAR